MISGENFNHNAVVITKLLKTKGSKVPKHFGTLLPFVLNNFIWLSATQYFELLLYLCCCYSQCVDCLHEGYCCYDIFLTIVNWALCHSPAWFLAILLWWNFIQLFVVTTVLGESCERIRADYQLFTIIFDYPFCSILLNLPIWEFRLRH